jgi:hypothetical protein
MGLIDKTTLLAITDRASAQYQMFSEPFETINDQGNGFYWELVTATNDPDVEAYLMGAYHSVDQDFDVDLAFKSGMKPLQLIVTSMDAHLNTSGVPGLWDEYLRDNDERVSYYFNKIHYAAKDFNLLANNVFSENEDDFGNWAFGDVFTDGIDYGDGSWGNRADGNNYAPTQIKAVIDATSTNCSSLILRIYAKDSDNNPITIDTPTISGGAGTEVNIGTSTDKVLDVTNIIEVSGGLAGNIVKIQNIKERTISL